MIEYGNRRVPRNKFEFGDLIIPFISKNPEVVIQTLFSYSKRKKRNMLNDSETSQYLVYLSFKRKYKLAFETLCGYFNVFLNEIPFDCLDEVMNKAELIFYSKYEATDLFLKKYIYSARISSYSSDIDIRFQSITNLSKLVSNYGQYNKSWMYGISEKRNDICANYLIRAEIREILNDAFNQFRKEKGLTPILSKWRSEQILFDLIKLEFNDLVVLGQGNPDWLAGQRFDVWLPEISVAVEFNGIQHYEPVDFFGGERGYLETKKRDEEKRLKCLQNNTILIEVRDGYNFEELKQRILDIIKLRSHN